MGWLVLVLVAGLASLTGCGGVEPVAPYQNLITDPTQIYTRLRLDYRVLTLDTAAACHCATWQLTATPRDARDSAMTGLPAPTFSPLSPGDTLTARVTADGLVTARQPGTTKILVELAVGNIRRADTAFIEVNNPDPLPTLASVSLDPLLPDSAIRPIAPLAPLLPGNVVGFTLNLWSFFGFRIRESSSYPLTPRALNTLGGSVTPLAFDFESLDPDTAIVIPAGDRRTATWAPRRPGHARLVVRTTAYGITVVDTTVFTVTMPVYGEVAAQPEVRAPSMVVFAPQEVHIRPNGLVFWVNLVDRPIDVTFDDPTNITQAPAVPCSLLDNILNFVPPGSYASNPFGPAPNCGAGSFTLASLPPAPTTPDALSILPTSLTVEIRQFPVVGVYPYHDASTGATGRVVVE